MIGSPAVRRVGLEEIASRGPLRACGGARFATIFPDRGSIIRLVGAVLAEQHDEWAEGRRYLGLDILTRAQAVDTTPAEEVSDEPTLQALTA
jgi:hypothetical protein